MSIRRVFVALTGASGVVYGVKLISTLHEMGIEVFATVTKNALKNAELEFGDTYSNANEFFAKHNLSDITYYDEDETDAAPASGSFLIDAYIIAPASMGFVGRASAGISTNLAERAADVAMKEGKPLVILFREMPLSTIHLENLTRLSKSGAVIMPAAPAFYHAPRDINDLICFTVGKVLDRIGIDNSLYNRWQ